MDCNKSNELMMQYMDGKISDFEFMNLQNHMKSCQICNEDFVAYSSILTNFKDNTDIIEAPEGFEVAVMTKVNRLNIYPAPKLDKAKILDNIIFVAAGVVFFLFGAGAALSIFQDEIITFLVANDMQILANIVLPYSSFISDLVDDIVQIGYLSINWISQNISPFSSIFFIVFILLVVIQLYISPKYSKILKSKQKAI